MSFIDERFHTWLGRMLIRVIIWAFFSAFFTFIFALIGGTHFDIFLNDKTRSSQIGRLISVSADIRSSRYPDISGEWAGIFKEYCPNNCSSGDNKTAEYIFTREIVKLTQYGGYVRGVATTHDVVSDAKSREWSLVGQYKGKTLTVSYEAIGDWHSQNPASGGTYIMVPSDDTNQALIGYWTGWDNDLGRIVTCPALMVRDHELLNFNSQKLRNKINEYIKDSNFNGKMSQPCTPDL